MLQETVPHEDLTLKRASRKQRLVEVLDCGGVMAISMIKSGRRVVFRVLRFELLQDSLVSAWIAVW